MYNSDDENMPAPVSNAMIEVEKSRAIQEVQGMMIIAKKFPRDENQAYARIMKACDRHGLAEKALYNYPKGGALISDASIRLAEVMAQNWGNIDFGVRELERKNGASIAESYCWDMETNTRQTKTFEVPHEIGLKGGKKKILTDPRDIYEQVANSGARRLRACILGIIPQDVKEAAVAQCRRTIAKGGGKTIEEIRKLIVLDFDRGGVNLEMLEKYLGHKMDLTTPDEIVDLKAIYNSIKDGHAKRTDFFDFPNEDHGQDEKAAAVSEKLKAKAEAKKEKPAPQPDNDPNSFSNFQG